MLPVVLAAQIVWQSAAAPSAKAASLPVIVWHPLTVRVPARADRLELSIGPATSAEAQWSVIPADSASLIESDTAEIRIQTNEYRGPLLLQAALGSTTTTRPAYAYSTMAVGCTMNLADGLRFDESGGASVEGNPTQSDIFVTGPPQTPRRPWLGCTGPFVRGKEFKVRTPYGGTVLHHWTGKYFTYVRASDWQNERTGGFDLQPGDILLFKTASGAIVKLLAERSDYVIGPYLAAAPGREFADYLHYVSQPKPKAHAIFGQHHP